MRILGISPLDKDSTVCLVDDGQIVSAIAEERLSRTKMHAGFPYQSLEATLAYNDIQADSIDKVVYAFQDWSGELELIDKALLQHHSDASRADTVRLVNSMKQLPQPSITTYGISGLKENELYIKKSPFHNMAYRLLSTNTTLCEWFANRELRRWRKNARKDHQHWSSELNKGLQKFGLQDKLVRVDHHLSHAANAYYNSGFEDALIVTLDGYGGGLGGSVSVATGGKIERIHSLGYPNSLGEFYERVTSSLGFKPGRHEGKIVGLAAYESSDILFNSVNAMFSNEGANLKYNAPHNYALSRYLASRYSKPAVAAAYQKVLEVVACAYIKPFLDKTGMDKVVLSGGVVANVKANQRIFEIDGVNAIFVHPNMGDGGCSVGAALVEAAKSGSLVSRPIADVYWGQGYDDTQIEKALMDAGVNYTRQDDIARVTAKLLADEQIVARFSGRMEYGPRSLGNRSILYHAKDPDVNLWLNTQLNRTEFMPFAPATLFEKRNECYIGMAGAEHAASFMTITFDCTELMKQQSPAAVHVDGTARPQLVSESSNASFHKILTEYHSLTGIPSVINTSFNMHEEPIVCTPFDAIRAFQLGKLPYLAIGNFLVKA